MKYTTFYSILVFVTTSVIAAPDATDSSIVSTEESAVAPTEHRADTTPGPSVSRQSPQKHFIVVKETEDSVFVLDNASLHDMIKNWKENLGALRKKGIGLSGTSTYGAFAVSMAPVEELVTKTPYLSGKQFHFGKFGYEPFFTSGGSGYIGLGDGLRLGGSGMTGRRTFSSSRFSGDSILALGVQVSYGGFLVEKAFVDGNWNYSAGGTIGGGTMKVTAMEKNSSSWFSSSEDDVHSNDDLFERGNSAEAGFFLFEPHGGFSYTFFHFFHIGVDAALPVCLSVEKFNVYTNDFITINPGVSIKLIFGNLG